MSDDVTPATVGIMVRFAVAAADLWAKLDTIACVFLLVGDATRQM